MNYNFLYQKNIKKLAVSITGFLKWIPDDIYLRLLYRARTGKKLNLSHPRRFNEKIQWLKVYDHKDSYVQMADKYAVKEYVRGRLGDDVIIRTLGLWDRFSEIDFDKLPNRFVLKCTHDSGGLVICTDKNCFDKDAAKKKIEACLKKNYYYQNREWVYKNISPRIIAEEYMEDAIQKELYDYKFMCFNGKVKCIFTCTERYAPDGLRVTFFDRNWEPMPFERHYPRSEKNIKKPLQYERMIEIAEKLSEDIPFVRVDMYEINGNVYFGELTFYPGSGMEEFRPDEWDFKMGEWLELPFEKIKR